MFKKLLITFFISFISVGGNVGFAQNKPLPKTPFKENQAAIKLLSGSFDIDPAHTRVSFVIPHLVISEVEGRFDDIKGTITIGNTFLASKFNAVIQIDSIDTGIKQRDDHLRSPDFFDAAKYPTMTFESKSITGTMDNFKMVAALTMKGVTKDILLTGKYTGTVKDQEGKDRIALRATGMINRKDFNIKFDGKVPLGPIVGDLVEIRLWTEGVKK